MPKTIKSLVRNGRSIPSSEESTSAARAVLTNALRINIALEIDCIVVVKSRKVKCITLKVVGLLRFAQ